MSEAILSDPDNADQAFVAAPNNASYYTDTDTGCECHDEPANTEGCACCLDDAGCQCANDRSVCVMCNDDSGDFEEWCQDPFYYFPPTNGE